ncbi:MAG: phosphopantothenoylcysteine decarboxylase [Planctomycetaceae bacterium]|nr:phosphopantothenoylcysteine decarboxylase [Planctomycetaceae bacterium]|tara:strand:- start:917 stop:1456 length:540 start_codon:yes stop_codon:yes gene_type:complete
MQNREILIGVTGGIAAYKSASLVSQLVQAESSVTVVMTPAATKFVGPQTFAALTGKPVATRTFASRHYPLGAHIELAQRAEVFCIAPASADCLAKLAGGSADELLSAVALCCTCPILIAPAMNAAMWEKPAVQRNLAQLKKDGFHCIDPQEGWLSCRQVGTGRMAEPEKIFAAIQKQLG